jgi:hypothetical protein
MYLPAILIIVLNQACATYEPQHKIPETEESGEEPTYSFFVAGGLGNSDSAELPEVFDQLVSQLSGAGENSTLLLTGDNISGMADQWERDKMLLDRQMALAKNFKGKVVFLPGSNEWKAYSSDALEKIEDYIKEADMDAVAFLPENACPLERREINDDLDLILINSQWFISNWSRIEGINKKCTDINTRRRFAEELEGFINDGQDKNIVIAMHHPVFSNGRYVGKESLKSHLLPLPVAGSILNYVGELGAFSPKRLNARRYRYLRILVTSLAQASGRIVVVSGHEESMQLLSGGDIRQIISGSMGGKTETLLSRDQLSTVGGTLPFEGQFTYGEKGFARLDYYKDGSSQTTFYGMHGNTYSFPVMPGLPLEEPKGILPDPPSSPVVETAILNDSDFLNRSGFYKFLWGDRYRRYFGTPVKARVVQLDTLYGGLKVKKEGGGHQSYSIRLEDKDGREFAMRSLRKSALKFLKFKVKGVAYTEDSYENTLTEDLVSDFFTTAHPYMQLVISPLARTAGINHSSPELFYVPKQEVLGDFNKDFGDELYFIEERPSDEQLNFQGYRRTIDERGEVKEFESTTDMLEKIREDESYSVDQRDFIRARIFDMLIGDWDRHQDQWRWIEFEKPDGDKVFQTIPRDRDNAFPRFDGVMMPLIHLFVPTSRRWETYDDDLDNIKWLNNGGNQLDRAILTKFDSEVWSEEAHKIQQAIGADDVDRAFSNLPEAVQDSTSRKIREDLKKRLDKLPEYAVAYSKYLDKVVALHGTEKDDLIEVMRLGDGKTRVVLRRLLSDEENELMFDRTFDDGITKEIWIYGLGDGDTFRVSGEAESSTFVRLIGGYGKDHYDITQKKNLKVYDWDYEELEFEAVKPATQLSDIYETNTYHWRFFEENNNILVPSVGFRTDDGLFLGATDTYTYNGFNGDPRQQHRVSAKYYFGFKALELGYYGVFANIFPKWDFEVDGYFTTNRYSQNFFGMGNESINSEDLLGRDYYRSRMQISRLSAGVKYHTLQIKALYESFKLMEIPGRYFVPENLDPTIFSTQRYLGGEVSLYYKNDDAEDFPTQAISFGLTSGYKWNPDLTENHFGYLQLYAGFSHKLIPAGHLVLSSRAEVKTNTGDNYFFYHAPSLGGNTGLRGYRDERFAGKTYFYQSSDLRLRIKRFVTAVAPITLGTYAGFDYGRVWFPGEDSSGWHNSIGGGLWVSGVDYLTFNAGYFHSEEGNIIQAGFGFKF